MVKALPDGQDIFPSHTDVGSVAAFPGASAAGEPTLALHVLSLPFV